LPVDERFLVRAQRVAVMSLEPTPVGAMIVRRADRSIPTMIDAPEHTVLGQAFNTERHDRLATGHAELKAVESANRHENSRYLDRYGAVTCYATCEPCLMCLVALSYAHVGRVVYRRPLIDVFPDTCVEFDTHATAALLRFPVVLEHRP
jgi:tRNA(Arg) A34 adenosine deaminase TadA